MKTVPNADIKTPNNNCRTIEVKEVVLEDVPPIGKSEEKKTVPGLITSLDCSVEFSFEKERIKAIENTQLFASVNTINNDCFLSSNKIKELLYNNKVAMDEFEKNCRDSKERIMNILKLLCIIFTLFATMNIIAVFFGMLFLSIANLPLANFIIWLCIELVTAILFVILSIQGSNINQYSNHAFEKYFKYLIIFCIFLIVLMIIIELNKDIKDVFKCGMSWGNENNEYNDNVLAMKCIMLLCVFCSLMYKTITLIVYIVLCMLIRRKIMNESKSELKVLAKDVSA